MESDLLKCVGAGEMCVACSSARKWCRAKVLRVVKQDGIENERSDAVGQGKDEVEAMLIDYGKMVKTKVSSVSCSILSYFVFSCEEFFCSF